MKRIALLVLLAAVAAQLMSAGRRADSPDLPAPPQSSLPAMQAHLDTSGAFVDSVGFLDDDFSAGMLDSLDSADDGLVEEAAPGGGMMVRTPGRYHTIYWGTRDSTGRATGDCLSPDELKQRLEQP